MTRQIKIDFYRVCMPDGAGITFEEILRLVDQSPNDEGRNLLVRDCPIRLQSLNKLQQGWEGDMIRIRMNEVPIKASLAGIVEPLEFEDNEGLGEETAFIYNPLIQVLMLQRNQSGVSASAISRYFQDKGALSKPIIFEPVFEGDTEERLEKLKKVSKFEVKLAGLDSMKPHGESGFGVNKILDLYDTFQSPTISLTLSMGHKKKGALKNILETAKSLLRFSNSEENTVQQIIISGTDDDGEEKQVLDLLGYRMREVIPVTSGARSISHKFRKDAMRKAWGHRQEELNKMFTQYRN